MTMKFCPNYRCAAYGRVVYTQSTRCAFCRWDLKPPRMKSETVGDAEPTHDQPGQSPKRDAPARADSPTQGKRPSLRHTA